MKLSIFNLLATVMALGVGADPARADMSWYNKYLLPNLTAKAYRDYLKMAQDSFDAERAELKKATADKANLQKQIDALKAQVNQLTTERNTAIKERNTAEANLKIVTGQRDAAIKERNHAVFQRDNAINERNASLIERNAALADRDALRIQLLVAETARRNLQAQFDAAMEWFEYLFALINLDALPTEPPATP